ncbi:hypothetical protein [Mucilaginibacter sp.]
MVLALQPIVHNQAMPVLASLKLKWPGFRAKYFPKSQAISPILFLSV